MKIKDRNTLLTIQEACQDLSVGTAVVCNPDSGCFRKHFGNRNVNSGGIVFNEGHYLSTVIGCEFDENIHHEQARILSTPSLLPSVYKQKLYQELEKNTGMGRNFINTRIKIIFGLAISALVENSLFTLYVGPSSNRHIAYEVPSCDIIKDFPTGICSIKDDSKTIVEKTFHYLWFNDKNDYTGYDKEIIKFSLQNWEMIK